MSIPGLQPLWVFNLESFTAGAFTVLFRVTKGKSADERIRPELIPVSIAWSNWEYFYSSLDEMLVHRRVTPSIKFAGTHLYTWVERGTVKVKCLAQEHKTPFTLLSWKCHCHLQLVLFRGKEKRKRDKLYRGLFDFSPGKRYELGQITEIIVNRTTVWFNMFTPKQTTHPQ